MTDFKEKIERKIEKIGSKKKKDAKKKQTRPNMRRCFSSKTRGRGLVSISASMSCVET
jgi:hypothetical protein